MGLDHWLSKDGEEIIRWRKANAIHRWFQENGRPQFNRPLNPYESSADLVQKVYEFQGPWLITLDDLKNLYKKLHVVKRLYEDGKKEDCKKVLPTQGGFFWGSEEIDDGYYEDVTYTIAKLDEIINKYKVVSPTEGMFEYDSWW